MRYSWTIDGLERVYEQGLTPGEVHQALAGQRRRLIQAVNGHTIRVIGRTDDGRLIEVWLREVDEAPDRDVWIAFEAGSLAQAQWRNAFGEEGQSDA